jgi:O-antigen ligase
MFEIALRRGAAGQRIRFSVPATCYLVAVAVSGVVAQDRRLAFYDWFVLVQAFLLYVYIHNRVRTRNDVLFLVTTLTMALLLEAAIMVGVHVVGHDVSLGIVQARIEDSRVTGTFGSPNVAGSFLALWLAPVASVWFMPLQRRRKILAGVAVLLGSLALLFTASRGAWVAFGLSGVIICAATVRRGWMPRWVPAAVAAGGILLVVPTYPLIADRIQGDDRGSAQSRIPLIEMGLRIIEESPVVGVGAGNSHHPILAESGVLAYRSEFVYTIHNKYILVGAETGLVGLFFFLWFVGDTVRQGWRGWRLQDRLLSPLALALTAAILGQMVHMLVDIFNSRPQVESFWCCAGLIAAVSHMHASGERGGAP